LLALVTGPHGFIHPGLIFKTLATKLGAGSDTLSQDAIIVWNLRLPRILGGLFVGASLAVSGAVIQTLFRNPLAEPFLIGISSGAAFGAVLSITLGFSFAGWSGNTTTLSSFAGGVGVAFLVYNLSRRGRRIAMATLLLTGIAIGGVLQSITTFLLLNYELQQIRSLMGWMMGSLTFVGWPQLGILAPYSVLGISMAWIYFRELNVLAVGEQQAQHMGVQLERTRLFLLTIATLLASVTVALCGIIAFIGLMVPHMVRAIIGANHKYLIPGSALGGGILLIVADLAARVIRPGQEIPIGIITSILGGLFFVALVQAKRF
ncbi:MAG: iron ABC transporter permease, partial [Verrucomicrobia bacterium]|nr:iron ABC transporter permease [Verrucomicrobiota bacterium]